MRKGNLYPFATVLKTQPYGRVMFPIGHGQDIRPRAAVNGPNRSDFAKSALVEQPPGDVVVFWIETFIVFGLYARQLA